MWVNLKRGVARSCCEQDLLPVTQFLLDSQPACLFLFPHWPIVGFVFTTASDIVSLLTTAGWLHEVSSFIVLPGAHLLLSAILYLRE